MICQVAETCGGCPQIALTPLQQQAEKVGGICRRSAAAGLILPTVEWLSDGAGEGYRNRIRLRLNRGVPQFFNEGKSPECAVLREELRAVLPAMRAWASAQREALAPFSHLELRAPDADGVGALTIYLPAGRGNTESGPQSELPGAPATPSTTEVRPFEDWLMFWQTWPEKENGAAVPHQRLLLGVDVYAYVPVTGFMQVNTGMNRQMVALVRRLAAEAGAKSFIDLFCGSGNLSLPLLKDGLRGAGAEIDSPAISALRRAAEEQGLDAFRFVAGDARAELFAGDDPVDLLITDPPRAGLRGDVGRICALTREALLICHCSVPSFVRDVAALVERGFTLERVVAIDMFPHTAQVELLSVLRRRSRQG